MTGWVEVVVIAFVAQLTVLPGEKVQFIIAGLSTRYHPLLVVGAAASAFAGWTAVEILAGSALQRALPGVALDALTAALFLLFAVLLFRSAPSPGASPVTDERPATDGGAAGPDDLAVEIPLVGGEIPEGAAGFLPIFGLMAVGEFGDKTQLITIALAAEYGATSAIWAGEMLAIVPVSLANAYFFHHFSGRFNARKAHLAAAGLFAFFGLDTLLDIVVGVSVWEQVVGTLADLLLALAGVVA